MKKIITIELVRDFDDDMLSRVLQAVVDLLRTGKPQGIGNPTANMMIHRDGSITTGVSGREGRGLAGSWRID